MAQSRTEIQARYDKKNTKHYGIKLNMKTDAALVDKLGSVESIQTYLKDLIKIDVQASPFIKEIARKSAEGYFLLRFVQNENEMFSEMANENGEKIRIIDKGNQVIVNEI